VTGHFFEPSGADTGITEGASVTVHSSGGCGGTTPTATPTSTPTNTPVPATATPTGTPAPPTATPTTTPTTTNQVCVQGTQHPDVTAVMTWVDNGNGTTTIKVTFSKNFVDNTYGTNAIGWPHGHKFNDLVGSDHVELTLFDASNTQRMQFDEDYISQSKTFPSGYGTLGVTGGDGKMLMGSASDVVNTLTSLDENFNQFGYVLTQDSPATDANYTPNPSYPNWIYDVWYQVTVKNSAFGTAGFGHPVLTQVHASPSKTGQNTEPVVPVPCS
jgi:hypothetical protein